MCKIFYKNEKGIFVVFVFNCCVYNFSKDWLVSPNKRSGSDRVLLTLKQTMQKKLIYEGINDHWQYMNAAIFLEQKCNDDIKKLNKSNATIIIWRSVPTSLDVLVSLEFLHCPELFHTTNKLEAWVISEYYFISFFADWKMPIGKNTWYTLCNILFHSNQASYLFFFQILFSGRDKSCLNLTLLLNTHRYQLLLKVPCPLRFVFLSMAGTMLALHWPMTIVRFYPDIPPLV